MQDRETFYEVMRQHGITRRSLLEFCSLTAAAHRVPPGTPFPALPDYWLCPGAPRSRPRLSRSSTDTEAA